MADSAFAFEQVPAPQPEPKPMGPVMGRERIDLIDILRGMALFGILAANMRGFFAPSEAYFRTRTLWPAGLDYWVQQFVFTMIQGKFVTLFSFLFGLGFAIQMERAAERGRSVWFYPRRLTVLLVFGLIHGLLIWWGDILLSYAVAGFMLLLFRKRKQKTVAIWGTCLYAAVFVLMTGFYVASFWGLNPPGGGPITDDQARKTVTAAIEAHRAGFLSHLRQNFAGWLEGNQMMVIGMFVFLLPRFLAGLWVYRSGVIKDVAGHLPIIRRVWLWSGVIGFAADAVMLFIRLVIKPPQGQFTFWQLIMGYADQIAPIGIALFYACSVAMLMQSARWQPRIAPFGAVGRMALTNYLAQSIVFVPLFLLTGLYGKLGPAVALVITVCFFAMQVLFSNWWLKQYYFGPAEWLWRSLTYGRMQPFRRTSPEPEAQAAAAQA